MATEWKKTGDWGKLSRAFRKHQFSSAMRKHIRRATELNGLLGVRTIRKVIQAGNFKPNKPLTTAIKGSTKPLVDNSSSLFQAIGQKIVDDKTVFVGVLKTDRFYNVGVALHEGTEITVTQRMRNLFYVLWKVSIGDWQPSKLSGRAAELWERMPGGWERLKPNTPAIVIPSRPFVKAAFDLPDLRKKARKNWEAAVNAAMREITKG